MFTVTNYTILCKKLEGRYCHSKKENDRYACIAHIDNVIHEIVHACYIFAELCTSRLFIPVVSLV